MSGRMRKVADGDLEKYVCRVATQARAASRALTATTAQQRNEALAAMAAALRDRATRIQAENAKDLGAAKENGLSNAMIDRLRLDPSRVEKMAGAVDQISRQPDPVGRVMDGWVLPDGVRIEKRRVPLGVIAIIFESRPNVTSDAAALCLKAGNA